jgi:glycosyltransferase involved in cell wall biosynthesis
MFPRFHWLRAHGGKKQLSLLINASRIGEVGGLRFYAEAVACCFGKAQKVLGVVPEGVQFRCEIAQRSTPKWLASSSRVSSLRAIMWWIYGATVFPARAGTHVLGSTHHVLPFRKRQVVTVHDIRPYYYPDNWVQRLNFYFLLPRALKKCDGVLTDAAVTRELLVAVYGLEADRIHVVPIAVDAEFFRPRANNSESRPPYLLSVGSTWKHKNIAELLRSHECWAPKYRLKIVAGTGQYVESLKGLASALELGDRVEFLTGLAATELLSLYQNCSALVYPSLMEGFGLPPLEAMACGRPVIVSDIPLFRELYGETPIFVRLGDPRSWDHAFSDLGLITDERLQKGVLHARTFTQERMKASLFLALRRIWGETFMHDLEL